METPLDVNDVSVVLDGGPAIQDASFVLHPGEITTIVGPNGAGKTTLARAAGPGAP